MVFFSGSFQEQRFILNAELDPFNLLGCWKIGDDGVELGFGGKFDGKHFFNLNLIIIYNILIINELIWY